MENVNRILKYIAKVGTGAKGAKNLDYEAARAAMHDMLDGAWHPVSLGAYLLAMRWKYETEEELAGFADAMRERLIGLEGLTPIPGLVDCAGAYDGKTRTLNVGIVAATIAAAAGVPLLLHGSEEIPTKQGVTPKHILERLGIDPLRTPTEVHADILELGIGYLHQGVVNPATSALLEERVAVGKRTLFNTVEPLTNPLGAEVHIGGFFHPPYAPRIARALALMRGPGKARRALMVQGIEGSDELRPGRALVAELHDGEVREATWDSAAWGLRAQVADCNASVREFDAILDESVMRIEQTLEGDAPAGFVDAVILNGGLRIYAAGHTDDPQAAIEQARELLANGAAARVLSAWQQRCVLTA